MATTKTINTIMGLRVAQRILERSDLLIDTPHDAISEAIRVLEDPYNEAIRVLNAYVVKGNGLRNEGRDRQQRNEGVWLAIDALEAQRDGRINVNTGGQ